MEVARGGGACAEAGEPAAGIDGPVSLDVEVVEVEEVFSGLKSRRRGAASG